MDFIIRFHNARKVVKQIRSLQWTPMYNKLCNEHLTANNGDLELWIGNGPFFCEIIGEPNHFGLFWRHYVWWFAASSMKHKADKNAQKPVPRL